MPMRRGAWARPKRGAAIVELAVVLPLLILLIVCGFDLLNAYIASNKVDLAVYRAARMASISGSTDQDVRKAALDEFLFIQSRGVSDSLNLTINRDLDSASIAAQIPVGKAAYLQPLLVKFGTLQRTCNRPIEFATNPDAIAELDAKPLPTQKGFNLKKGKGG